MYKSNKQNTGQIASPSRKGKRDLSVLAHLRMPMILSVSDVSAQLPYFMQLSRCQKGPRVHDGSRGHIINSYGHHCKRIVPWRTGAHSATANYSNQMALIGWLSEIYCVLKMHSFQVTLIKSPLT